MQILPKQPLYVIQSPENDIIKPALVRNTEEACYDFCVYTTKEHAEKDLAIANRESSKAYKVSTVTGIDILEQIKEADVYIGSILLFNEDYKQPAAISIKAIYSAIYNLDPFNLQPAYPEDLGGLRISEKCDLKLRRFFENIGGVDICMLASVNDDTKRLFVFLVGDTDIGTAAWEIPLGQILREENFVFSGLDIRITREIYQDTLEFLLAIDLKGGTIIQGILSANLADSLLW